jgi:hypothetical protein
MNYQHPIGGTDDVVCFSQATLFFWGFDFALNLVGPVAQFNTESL